MRCSKPVGLLLWAALSLTLAGVLLIGAGLGSRGPDVVRAAPDPNLGTSLESQHVPLTGPLQTFLPAIHRDWCAPGITISYVGPYGSFDDMQGEVQCVDPADYKVAVYNFGWGWWTKPYWATPLTSIQPDGTWTCDVTTGVGDELATSFAAFLVPNGYSPPLMSGGQTLPEELYQHSVASTMVSRPAASRQVQFAGYTWQVKASETPVGPGPNYFSGEAQDVWVDQLGRLHLRIVQRGGRWYSTEVYSTSPLGYGTYVFRVASDVGQLDQNAVLGLFTWDDAAPAFNYRELDVEFSRWGQPTNANAQYVVQPYTIPGHVYRFDMTSTSGSSTHCFDWRTSQVRFASFAGNQDCPGGGIGAIASWTYSGSDIPPAGSGNARLNFWLLDGNTPANGAPAEVVIEAFEPGRNRVRLVGGGAACPEVGT